ncbi:MAG: transposase domain-containing protein [Lachnospiraceae bacterium]|nr:transposase domain-containing protein [Lachnospiraceae bacterium]
MVVMVIQGIAIVFSCSHADQTDTIGIGLVAQFLRLCSIEHNRKNWVNIDTIRGAEASAVIYSLVETAKANHLRVYDYFEYILTEPASHQDDTSREFLADLMPWSEKAQEKCGHPKKS